MMSEAKNGFLYVAHPQKDLDKHTHVTQFPQITNKKREKYSYTNTWDNLVGYYLLCFPILCQNNL